MSTEENKAVVRRFITEVLVGGDVDVADEVLAPNYMNRAMGTYREAFKAFIQDRRRRPDHDAGSDAGVRRPDARRRLVGLPPTGRSRISTDPRSPLRGQPSEYSTSGRPRWDWLHLPTAVHPPEPTHETPPNCSPNEPTGTSAASHCHRAPFHRRTAAP